LLKLGLRDKEDWKCLACNRIVKTHNGARRHVQFVHLGASQNATCPICRRSFSRKQHMLRHIKTIHAPTPSAGTKGQAASSQFSEDEDDDEDKDLFVPKVEIMDDYPEMDDDDVDAAIQ
jgi:hypothetical protein